MLKDKYSTIAKGFFKIETLDSSGVVIDSFEEDNLIMDLARTNMCELVAGVTPAGSPINKFVLGTAGHIGTDILAPRTSTEGFTSSRTSLFSQGTVPTPQSTVIYPITFTGTGSASGEREVTSEPDSGLGSSTVTVTQVGTTVTYEIFLPAQVANNTGIVAYTEAGFYCGTELFNLKTFAAKVKSESVTIRVTWSISF
jgi:hypothetical protein